MRQRSGMMMDFLRKMLIFVILASSCVFETSSYPIGFCMWENGERVCTCPGRLIPRPYSATSDEEVLCYEPPAEDECKDNNGGCEHTCTDTPHSFYCSCYQGYIKSGSACFVDTCSNQNGGCEQKCKSSRGSTTCSCGQGFAVDGKRCHDIDECQRQNGGCVQICTNNMGSFECACQSGFFKNGPKCDDIDECQSQNGGCEQTCSNTVGSRLCSCMSGFTKIGTRCQDIDECQFQNGGCDQICSNTLGSRVCSCKAGFVQNDKACDDNWEGDLSECLEKYSGQCPDYLLLLKCLENITLHHQHNQTTVDLLKSIRDGVVEEMSKCPGFIDKVHCITEEIDKCKEDLYHYLSSGKIDHNVTCLMKGATVSCLRSLKPNCSNHDFLGNMIQYEQLGEDCDDHDPRDQCSKDIRKCMDNLEYPYHLGNIGACDLIQPTRDCLQTAMAPVGCDNNDTRHYILEPEEKFLDSVDEACEVLVGDCTHIHFDNCSNIVYIGQDNGHANCSQPSIDRAIECFDVLEPICTTRKQKQMFNWDKHRILQFCKDN